MSVRTNISYGTVGFDLTDRRSVRESGHQSRLLYDPVCYDSRRGFDETCPTDFHGVYVKLRIDYKGETLEYMGSTTPFSRSTVYQFSIGLD